MVGDRNRAYDAGGGVRLAVAGGHLRVGMEDTLTFARGVPVESNAQLVERAVEAGRVAQRTRMSTTEARELLGVKAR